LLSLIAEFFIPTGDGFALDLNSILLIFPDFEPAGHIAGNFKLI
jgi:hypothetical protein